MAGTGVNREAGSPLSGFEHVKQSIGVILTTPIGSRVMRREFGAELMDLIDRPMTEQVILAVYAATVMAIARWEPRFSVVGCQIKRTDVSGEFEMEIAGIYYPRGHLGDFSVSQNETARIVFGGR